MKLEELYNHRSKFHEIRVEGNELGKVLYIDGIVHLTTVDIHRYSECIGIVPYLFTKFAKNILMIGGGDGYTIKTLLNTFSSIEKILVVEEDSELMEVGKTFFEFPEDERIVVTHSKPRELVNGEKVGKIFDLAIVDHPQSDAKLLTQEYFESISDVMKDDSVFVVSCVSPFFNPKAASCMLTTVRQAFPTRNVVYYKVHLPMNPCPAHKGFCLATPGGIQITMPHGLKYLNEYNVNSLFWMDNDEVYVEMPASVDWSRLYAKFVEETYIRDIDEWEK